MSLILFLFHFFPMDSLFLFEGKIYDFNRCFVFTKSKSGRYFVCAWQLYLRVHECDHNISLSAYFYLFDKVIAVCMLYVLSFDLWYILFHGRQRKTFYYNKKKKFGRKTSLLIWIYWSFFSWTQHCFLFIIIIITVKTSATHAVFLVEIILRGNDTFGSIVHGLVIK